MLKGCSPPATLHRLFPPDLLHSPRQRRFDLALSKGGKVVISGCDILSCHSASKPLHMIDQIGELTRSHSAFTAVTVRM